MDTKYLNLKELFDCIGTS